MFTKDDVQRLIADIGAAKPGTEESVVPVAEDGKAVRWIGNRDVNLATPATDLNVDLTALEMGEPYMFGLALDAFDPVSGQVFVVTRPHIQNSTQPEVFVTLRQLAAEVGNARMAKLHSDRLAGVLTLDQQKARDAAAEQAKADQAKQEVKAA